MRAAVSVGRRGHLFYRRILDLRFAVRAFDFENDGPQAVVTAANGYAGFAYPVAVIEQAAVTAGSVRERENVLVYGLPGFIAKSVRAGVVGVKDLAFPEHRAGGQPFRAVFFRQFLIKRLLQHRNLTFVHSFSVLLHNRGRGLFRLLFRNRELMNPALPPRAAVFGGAGFFWLCRFRRPGSRFRQSVLGAPLAHGVKNRNDRPAALGQAVLNLGRNLRVFPADNQFVRFQLFEHQA